MGNSRKAAVNGIVRIHKGGWANLTAKNILAAPGLSDRDKAFASAIFYGTAERLVTLDYLLQPFLKKPIEKLDVEVRAILETGLYQVNYMNVPPRAAVDESVKLTRKMGKGSASGLVNAVLRRATTTNLEDAAFSSELERVCVTYSVGQAVAKAVMASLPEEYEAYLAASFSKPNLCIRVNTTKTTEEELESKLVAKGATVKKAYVKNALYAEIPGGVIGDLLFEQGYYHVQGEASQYTCSCLNAQKNDAVLDLCAAPGGKSATLLQYTNAPQKFLACDVRPNRIPLIHETCKRLGFSGVKVMENDASIYNPELGSFDKVLCDVPCSGLGVLGSKPDIRYNDGAGFTQLPALQLKILQAGARYVKEGGRIVYSTCTIRPEENEQIVKAFLAENSSFKLVSANELPVKPIKGCKIEDEMITFLPNRCGLDGFFVATLVKV